MVEVNEAFLAHLAKSNSQVLNDKPLREGQYDITFELEGFNYIFKSDGTYWSWHYSQK